ncbi:PIG-L deacetylase family protein [Nocardia fluminea]|uniref:GlcNAc-PI de-N-acetylase n=1 Tax=Nocardia fluminea TaxID=134984 RepID=A0A2N3WWH7_9NOCA|nr:PIG-L deacetylase family protein [Nocardia fluminea]PKV98232.1 GlcNAc-PI de-N-acetylase [Nocardia fluminea]
MIGLFTTPPRRIAVLGAHCDDIAIGMGATLLALTGADPEVEVRALVLSGGGTAREEEERAALTAFCSGNKPDLHVLDVPDGRAPAHWDRIKDALADFRRGGEPEVVFAPHRGDAHQDHRLLAELVPTEFRDHLTLGYEILKWETDAPATTLYHPLSHALVQQKSRLLHEHYPSQTGRDWFDEQAFLGLARMRGVQCHAPYAEAFVLDKAIIRWEQT